MNARSIAVDITRTAVTAAALVAALTASDHVFHHVFHRTLAHEFAVDTLWITCGNLVLWSLLERLVPAGGPRKSFARWLFHLRIGIVFKFLNLPISILITTAVAAAAAALRPHVHLGLIDLRFGAGKGFVAYVGGILLSIIIGDFFAYWYHRLEHKSIWLWQVHKLHHMDQELDVLTNLRLNWIQSAIDTLFGTVPLMVLFRFDGDDAFQVGLFGGVAIWALNSALDNLTHFNARLHLGWFGHLFCGPQMHRIHHSRLLHHQNKNFCGTFTPWDILFGTYYPPARDEFPPTGVEGEQEVQSVLEAHTLPLREWWRMSRGWRRRTAAAA